MVSILYICIYINIQIYIHIDSSQGNIYTEHHHHQCTLARSHRRANWQLQVSCVLCSWLYGSCNKGTMLYLSWENGSSYNCSFGPIRVIWLELGAANHMMYLLAWSGLHLRGRGLRFSADRSVNLNDECVGTPGLETKVLDSSYWQGSGHKNPAD